jgi:hypothetical protein
MLAPGAHPSVVSLESYRQVSDAEARGRVGFLRSRRVARQRVDEAREQARKCGTLLRRPVSHGGGKDATAGRVDTLGGGDAAARANQARAAAVRLIGFATCQSGRDRGCGEPTCPRLVDAQLFGQGRQVVFFVGH